MRETGTEVDTAELDQVAPVEYPIVEFTSGRVPADTFHLLLDLVEGDSQRDLDVARGPDKEGEPWDCSGRPYAQR